MIRELSPITQTLLGTLFTWGLTALGASFVFFFSSADRRVLDGSLGFAAGVMTAASYWSLLSPAIELAENSGLYGENGEFAFIPAAVGFLIGALFIFAADSLVDILGVSSPNIALALQFEPKENKEPNPKHYKYNEASTIIGFPDGENSVGSSGDIATLNSYDNAVYQRKKYEGVEESKDLNTLANSSERKINISWRRICLLIVAITVHNIPEGLAVGVGFGAVKKTESATFEKARSLAIGIGIQNFPEGLAVSLPLRGAGFSVWRSFWYGQLSGMVEPVAGILGALAVTLAEPILPYALAFAAGAMIYVVFDDIIPETRICGNGKLATWTSMLGFLVMMCLDVGLG